MFVFISLFIWHIIYWLYSLFFCTVNWFAICSPLTRLAFGWRNTTCVTFIPNNTLLWLWPLVCNSILTIKLVFMMWKVEFYEINSSFSYEKSRKMSWKLWCRHTKYNSIQSWFILMLYYGTTRVINSQSKYLSQYMLFVSSFIVVVILLSSP